MILSVPGLTGTWRMQAAGITVRGPPETVGIVRMEYITISSSETPNAPVNESD